MPILDTVTVPPTVVTTHYSPISASIGSFVTTSAESHGGIKGKAERREGITRASTRATVGDGMAPSRDMAVMVRTNPG